MGRFDNHIAQLQGDLTELRSAYADLAQQHSEMKTSLGTAREDSTFYKNLAHKLSEKLDMMETAVCNLVSMMFRK